MMTMSDGRGHRAGFASLQQPGTLGLPGAVRHLTLPHGTCNMPVDCDITPMALAASGNGAYLHNIALSDTLLPECVGTLPTVSLACASGSCVLALHLPSAFGVDRQDMLDLQVP